MVKLYVNAATPVLTNGVNYNDARPAQAPPLRIGAGWNEPQETQPAQFFMGRIDEVAIYDKTFLPADIKTHFDYGKQAILYVERNPKTVKSITSFPYILKSL